MSTIQPIRRLRDVSAENDAHLQRMQAYCLVADSLLRRAERQEQPHAELLMRLSSLYLRAHQASPRAVRPLLGLAHVECLWGSEQRALRWLEHARHLQPRHSEALKRWALLKKQLKKASR